ncbi:MAG: type II secretion system protein [Fibrobacter sp.]|nr:type II secretion system protein [Fibrobacter sp.]
MRCFFGNKRGIGIAEILVAAAVLGFLLTALNQLQKSNYESLWRIRARDGANMVAQDVLDSLNAVGIAALSNNNTARIIKLVRSREWESQPGLLNYTIHVDYDVTVSLSDDAMFQSENTSNYLDSPIKHVYAKNATVNVAWKLKGKTHSISVSGVVR